MEAMPPLMAPLMNALALLLALGFRRNRAVLMLAVLTLSALALCGYADMPERAGRSDSVRMFAPWLLLAVATMPERGLLARRNLLLLLLMIVATWLSLAAPEHVWIALRGALPLGVLPWNAATVAMALAALAAGACLLRWVLRGGPMEAGLSIVLLAVAFALSPLAHNDSARLGFALAGACALLAVLYASYRMAFVDMLTGLPNRRALDEALARLSGNYAVAMIDVDNFKRFNDTHGHAAGDLVLKAVARQLERTRAGRAFRFGGEEFCILFGGANCRRAAQACEDARQRIENARVHIRPAPEQRRRVQAVKRGDAGDVRVTVSIGLAERDAHTRMATDVLKAADQALYRAKAKGRNRLVEG